VTRPVMKHRAARVMLRTTIAVWGLGLGAAGLGCGRDPVEVATFPAAGEDAEGPTCSPTSMPCPAGEFCSGTCADPSSGHCQKIVASSTCTQLPFSPVCGADGVSYFNDCLRRAAQQSLCSLGQCLPPPLCADGGVCPGAKTPTFCETTCFDKTQSCAQFLSFPPPLSLSSDFEKLMCTVFDSPQAAPFHFCWRLPDECPDASSLTVQACESGGELSAPIDGCAAIRDGGVLIQTPTN
jgi:hypothetical protein